MKNPVFIGVDFGTSSIKICLFDQSGTLLREDSAPIHVEKSGKNISELNLEDIRNRMLGLLKTVVVGYEKQIVSMGFSVTSPTLVLFDRELHPVRNGVLYLDNRSEQEVAAFAESLGGREAYFKYVGNSPSPSTCLPGILHWIQKYEPDSWSRTYKFGYLNSYLASVLTGKLAVDPTTVSYSGLATVADPYHWDPMLVKAADIKEDKLPEIIPCFRPVGFLTEEMAQLTGLTSGIPVAIGSADTAASSLALGLKKHGDTFDSVGTSEVLGVCLDAPAPHAAFMNRCHVIPGLWLAQGAMSTTGAAINWIRNSIFPELTDIRQLEEEALRAGVGADSLLFLPYLSGERSPIFDPNTCGVFFGLTTATQRKEMIRAVYEAPGYGIRQLYEIARDTWNIAPEYIRCVGGASKSRLVLQVRSDMTNLPYKAMEIANSAAYGAAMMGAAAAEYYSIYEVPSCQTFSGSVEPIAENHEIYMKNFRIYNSLYSSLKELMHLHKAM